MTENEGVAVLMPGISVMRSGIQTGQTVRDTERVILMFYSFTNCTKNITILTKTLRNCEK